MQLGSGRLFESRWIFKEQCEGDRTSGASQAKTRSFHGFRDGTNATPESPGDSVMLAPEQPRRSRPQRRDAAHRTDLDGLHGGDRSHVRRPHPAVGQPDGAVGLEVQLRQRADHHLRRGDARDDREGARRRHPGGLPVRHHPRRQLPVVAGHQPRLVHRQVPGEPDVELHAPPHEPPHRRLELRSRWRTSWRSTAT